jgi:putative inorganic carbon (hco3(-)) transporter
MRDILVFGVLLALYPLVLASPFAGTQIYTWLSFSVPYHQTWNSLPFPWVALAGALTLLGWLVRREPKNVFRVPLIPLLFVYYAWTTITLQFALAPAAGFDKWEDFSKIVLMTCVTAAMLNDRTRIQGMAWMFGLAFAYYGVWGGIVTVLAPNMNVVGPPGTPWAQTNGVARAFVMTMPLVGYLYFHSRHRYARLALLGLLACYALALVGTNSRGGWVAAFAGGSYLIWRSRQRLRLATALAVVAAVLLMLIPEPRHERAAERLDSIDAYEYDASAQSRFEVWSFGYDLALSRPIVGGGFEVYTLPLGRERALAPHSNYFEVLGEHGFVGLALYLALLVGAWRACRNVERMAAHRIDLFWARDLSILLRAGLLGYAVGGIFINFAHNQLFYAYLALVGGTLLTVRRAAESCAPAARAAHLPERRDRRAVAPSDDLGRNYGRSVRR